MNKRIRCFSRAFTLLPTLVVLLSISVCLCSILFFEKNKNYLLEKQKKAFECELNNKNEEIEKDWFNEFD